MMSRNIAFKAAPSTFGRKLSDSKGKDDVVQCIVSGKVGSAAVTDRVAIAANAPTIARKFSQTFTLTFGDQAENHVGMQKIGSLASEGFSKEELERARAWFQEREAVCELIDLAETLPEAKGGGLK